MNTYPIKCLMRAENGATRVDVYDDIGDGGWPGEGLTAKGFTAQLATVTGPLDVHINSYGGSVADGIAIGNAIRAHAGRKRTIVDGMAASIASVILQAGDERVVLPGSMVMIHDASTVCMGNAADMAKTAADLDKHSANLAAQYAARAGGSPESWREAMRAETWYTADEAVKAGLADTVGAGAAALPPGLDLDAFTTAAVPERIVASLRALPRREVSAAYKPAPYKRESYENVQCPTCGMYGDDDAKYCGQCGIQLSGRDDVTSERAPGSGDGTGDGSASTTAHGHSHVHDAASHAPFTGKHTHAHPAYGSQGDDGAHEHEHTHQDDANHHHQHPAGAATDYLRRTVAAHKAQAAQDAREAAVRALEAGFTVDQILDAMFAASDSVDESDWDGDRAMAAAGDSDDPAATFKSICAGRREGDPSLRKSWALPYRYPGKGPNAGGVRNALSRLPQTQGLTNEAAAKALLERLMKQINPDYDGGDASDHAPAWMTDLDQNLAVPAWLEHA